LVYGIIIFVTLGLRLYVKLRNLKIPGIKVRIPKPGRNGDRALTELLAEIVGKIGHSFLGDSLRVTLFVPDLRKKELVQVARKQTNGRDSVSATRIRMGVCTVGHAYARAENTYVPDVEIHGGFRESLRLCGMTDDEIQIQTGQQQQSFAAVPVFSTDSNGYQIVLAVVAVDSVQSNLPNDIPTIVAGFEGRIRRSLLKSDAPEVLPPRDPPRGLGDSINPCSHFAPQ
jgi:hypothetical protein